MFKRYLILTFFFISLALGARDKISTLDAIKRTKEEYREFVSMLNYKTECGLNPLKKYRRMAREYGI